MAFTDAVNVKAVVKALLEGLGIEGYYQISITDKGPQLTVHVAPKDIGLATEALQQRLLSPPAVVLAPIK